jgi:hypothetical protein
MGRTIGGMSEQQPDLAGDYGYDLAHDVPRREQAAAHSDPARPRSTSTAAGGTDRGVDLEYDEAHDF